MGYAWKFTIDDLYIIYKIAEKLGRKPGDNIEDVIIAYAKEKEIKPLMETNKDIDQITGDLREAGLKVFNMKEFKRQQKLKEDGESE